MTNRGHNWHPGRIISAIAISSLFLAPFQLVFADISVSSGGDTLSDLAYCTGLQSGNYQGYEYLGQGLSGSLSGVDLKVKATTPTFYGKGVGVRIYSSDDYLDNYSAITADGTLVWQQGNSTGTSVNINGYDGVISFTSPQIGADYTFDPLLHYYLLPILLTFDGGGICQGSYFYGYQDGTTYENGQYSGDSIISDLYFVLHGLDLVPVPPPTPSCCSTVVFLPGIKGSKLMVGNDTIWPPTVWSDDVPQLGLYDNGQSIYDVKVDGIVNSFYGAAVYSGFSSFMDSLASIDPQSGTSTIKEWYPLAYDWRFDPEWQINNGVNTPNGTVDILTKIENLAAQSYTGRVTIVAHSMGGLLGKAIIKALDDKGESNLLDSFIMVGTPQLGTPQAVGSLLHGDGEGILDGFIVDRSDVRQVARNMQSSYDLLPSPEYFAKVSDPVISFDENSTFTSDWRNLWGDFINNYNNFSDFLTGNGVIRTRPSTDNLSMPEVLRSDLVQNAEDFHNVYDNYVIPANIKTIQIAGWGIPTVKDIKYQDYHSAPGYTTLFTREGDGTVVYPSALVNGNNEYYFNVFDYNDNFGLKSKHKDLLSAQPVESMISNVIKGTPNIDNAFISISKPVLNDIGDQLIISTHSPVLLGAYDVNNNFTGLEQNSFSGQDVIPITENIPSSNYLYSGDGQYIFVPKNGKYKFVFKGTGSGQVTVNIDDFSNDQENNLVSYTDIPVSADSRATFDIDSANPGATNIKLDSDGNGTVDNIVLPDGANTADVLLSYLEKLRVTINNSSINPKNATRLNKEIDKIEKKLGKSTSKLNKEVAKLEKGIDKLINRGRIDDNDANSINDILSQIELLI